MTRYYFEYNDQPGMIESEIEDGNLSFIVVYKEGEFNFIKKEFSEFMDAMEWKVDAETRLVFVVLKEKDSGKGTFKHVHLNDDLQFELDVRIWNHNPDIEIFPSGKSFFLKLSKNSREVLKKREYKRSRIVKIDKNEKKEYYKSYLELVPEYKDIFLESIFFLDIMKNNSAWCREELEAFFMRGKFKVESKGVKKSNKKNTTKDEKEDNFQTDNEIELDKLIGLHKVKLEVQELKALAKLRQKRLSIGLPVTPSTLHMIFVGNPGTGKTTVARLLGQIYSSIGLLSTDKVIEVSRQDLVGQYVGHTAPKTQKVFKSALGGILFIDEAYSLFKTGNDFGKEAVETLLKLMEDNREDIVIILAGYPNEMNELVSSNPGLKSRFSKTLHFENYDKEELMAIFNGMIEDYGNDLTDGARYKVELLIEENYESGGFSSNARTTRNIVDHMIKKQSHRLSKEDEFGKEAMILFLPEDVPDNLS